MMVFQRSLSGWPSRGQNAPVFAQRLIADLLLMPAHGQGTFALVDTDSEHLGLVLRMWEKLVAQSGRSWTF
jgi:alpha-galactosidase/6-phospho-beta-glucosidase family protein